MIIRVNVRTRFNSIRLSDVNNFWVAYKNTGTNVTHCSVCSSLLANEQLVIFLFFFFRQCKIRLWLDNNMLFNGLDIYMNWTWWIHFTKNKTFQPREEKNKPVKHYCKTETYVLKLTNRRLICDNCLLINVNLITKVVGPRLEEEEKKLLFILLLYF